MTLPIGSVLCWRPLEMIAPRGSVDELSENVRQ
jgi:hypothetical protein